MARFYILRTYTAEVTEVSEIEADSMQAAYARRDENETIGFSVGDRISDRISDCDIQILPAAPHNLPLPFARCE